MLIATAAVLVQSPTVGAAGTATVSPGYVRANTRVMFTVTVTNGYTSDNIDNVRIVAPGFTQALGYAENLVLAAENLENAAQYLQQAGENMLRAEDNKVSTGPDFKAAGDNLGAVTDAMLTSENVNSSSVARAGVVANLANAKSALGLVANAIGNTVENLNYISNYLGLAGYYLRRASGIGAAGDKENMENINDAVGENLDNAGYALTQAAIYILSGNLATAGGFIRDAGENLTYVGAHLNQTDLQSIFTNAGNKLKLAGQKLIDAGAFLGNAGYDLGVAENYLTSAGARLASITILGTAGSNLQIAASLIENAGMADNLLRAGENLRLASDNLDNVALELGADLGMDNMRAAAVDIGQAADNLRNGDRVSITTAGNELKSAATKLSSAAAKMKLTSRALSPTTWKVTAGADYVQFDAIGDNVITPGGQQTFVFLWTTPSISTEADYTVSVLVSKEETVYTAYENLGGFTVRVDGKAPTLTINVTQSGVAQPNLVGNKLDNGRATITIVASEALSSLGEVRVENAGNRENLIPPIPGSAFATTDNITFTYQYITVGAWDDNVVAVRVLSAKDRAGNETTDTENRITVDTRAPILIQNGLAGLISGMRENVVQPGTGARYRYVDNSATKNMVIVVEDNALNAADNCTRVVSVTINGEAATRDPLQNNRWTKTITLAQGFNSAVIVRAVDVTGNWVEENVENIFIDTHAPVVTFDEIAGKTWTDGVKIADNTPLIKVTIVDPGYPTSGLGVARENLFVYLDNDDNVNNGTPPFGGLLENRAPWDPATGVFENILDNLAQRQGKGLLEGTYYIIVVANDNLAHAGDNENWVIAKRSFVIDITPPTVPTPSPALNPLYGTSITSPMVTVSNQLTIRGEGLSTEAGATIKIHIRNAATGEEISTATTTVGTDGRWSKTITLPQGGVALQIEVTCIDEAGNESESTLYGFVLLDDSAPSVTISSPCATGQTYKTSKTTVVVSGRISKDPWETYNSGTRAVTATIQVGSATPGTVTINSDGTFSISAALNEGSNTITIRAVDSAGNIGSATITVTRTVTPWATYAVILVIVALILAAIAILRVRK